MGMTEHERDILSHLANDWDAQAADIERKGFTPLLPSHRFRAEALRECAGQLRAQLLELRAPVPHVIREVSPNSVSWGPVFDAPWPPSADLKDGLGSFWGVVAPLLLVRVPEPGASPAGATWGSASARCKPDPRPCLSDGLTEIQDQERGESGPGQRTRR